MVAAGLISFGVGMAVGAAFNNSCCGWGWGYGGWGLNYRNTNYSGNNKVAWNSGDRNSGNTINRCGNTVNINGDVNVGSNARGGNTNNRVGDNNVNANNRVGNNNAQL